MPVTLYALGTGDADTKTNFWTHFFVECAGRRLFVDCPGPFDKLLPANQRDGEMPVSIADYNEILMTHLHRDHADGLAEIANRNLRAGLPRPKLYAPQWMLDDLLTPAEPWYLTSAKKVTGGAAALERAFEFVPIAERHDFGPFSIDSRTTRHSPRCQAYRFDFGDVTLGYSADTGNDPALDAWLGECDVVLHEAYINPMPADSFLRGLHTPLEDLLTRPRDFQNKTFLVHYADNFRDVSNLGGYRFLERGKAYHFPAIH